MSDVPVPRPVTGATADAEVRDATVPPDAELFAFRFDHPLKAQEAMLTATRLLQQQRLALDDAAIVVKQASGRVQLIQTRDTTTGQGAVSGSWLGMLAGLFVPGGVLIGAALGAAVGGIWAKLRDIGIDDDEMKEMGEQLPEGEAALFLLVTDYHRVHVATELRRFDGELYASTASDDCKAWIRDTLARPVTWG